MQAVGVKLKSNKYPPPQLRYSIQGSNSSAIDLKLKRNKIISRISVPSDFIFSSDNYTKQRHLTNALIKLNCWRERARERFDPNLTSFLLRVASTWI